MFDTILHINDKSLRMLGMQVDFLYVGDEDAVNKVLAVGVSIPQ